MLCIDDIEENADSPEEVDEDLIVAGIAGYWDLVWPSFDLHLPKFSISMKLVKLLGVVHTEMMDFVQ